MAAALTLGAPPPRRMSVVVHHHPRVREIGSSLLREGLPQLPPCQDHDLVGIAVEDLAGASCGIREGANERPILQAGA
eukprot:14294435-Alexandrium_andersonii.AAC.2